MKPILLLLFFCSASSWACAQGSVNFANSSATAVYCDFVGPGGQRVPAGSYFMAELMYAPDGTPTDAFNSVAIRVGAPASFFLPGLFAGGGRTVQSITPSGGFGLFQVRVWETAYGSSYNDLVTRGLGGHAGTSAILRVDTGDPTTTPPGTTASLVSAGLTSFTIAGLSGGPPCIPEPTTWAIMALAVGVFYLRSRRQI